MLDCYAGSGSTLLSAKRLMRKSIGIELEDRYINIIKNMLGFEVKPTLKINRNPQSQGGIPHKAVSLC